MQYRESIWKIERELKDIEIILRGFSISLIGILAEEKEKRVQAIFEDIVNENFLELIKVMNSQILEAQGIPNHINNKSIPADFIMKPKNTEDKEMIKSQERR